MSEPTSTSPEPLGRVSTGITGLDEVLGGGLSPNRIYLVRGGAGTGKTTLGFQFLLDGVRRGERVLYLTLLQSASEIDDVLASHGWSRDGIDLMELPDDVRDASATEQTFFSTAEVELNEVTDAITRAIERHRPQRLVLDSISELGVLVESPAQLRRHVLKLKMQLHRTGCTSMVTMNEGETNHLGSLESLETLVHGVIHLDVRMPVYGPSRRKLEVVKLRGVRFLEGAHDFSIRTGGLAVHPRLQLSDQEREPAWRLVASGNKELDALLGGGLESGTACLVSGTTGAGKSTLASLYVEAAAERGDRSAVFCFDERKATFLRRARGLGMKIPEYTERGLVDLREVNVGDLTPGEFVQTVRRTVDHDGIKVLVLDSISGYLNAMADERQLMTQLHELLRYLSERDVLSFLIVASHGLLGGAQGIDASYIADTVVLMRHFEARGAMRRCISVVKKRHGRHEPTIREVQNAPGGLRLGPPLEQFSGVLSGTPTYHGANERLLDERSGDGGGGDHDHG